MDGIFKSFKWIHLKDFIFVYTNMTKYIVEPAKRPLEEALILKAHMFMLTSGIAVWYADNQQ